MILGLGVYAWSIALMSWGMKIQGPNISLIPLADFASRLASAGMAEASPAHALSGAAGASEARMDLEVFRFFLREMSFDQGREVGHEMETKSGGATDRSSRTIGFSTKAKGYEKLKRHEIYY